MAPWRFRTPPQLPRHDPGVAPSRPATPPTTPHRLPWLRALSARPAPGLGMFPPLSPTVDLTDRTPQHHATKPPPPAPPHCPGAATLPPTTVEARPTKSAGRRRRPGSTRTLPQNQLQRPRRDAATSCGRVTPGRANTDTTALRSQRRPRPSGDATSPPGNTRSDPNTYGPPRRVLMRIQAAAPHLHHMAQTREARMKPRAVMWTRGPPFAPSR